jgi:hypothetical protein
MRRVTSRLFVLSALSIALVPLVPSVQAQVLAPEILRPPTPTPGITPPINPTGAGVVTQSGQGDGDAPSFTVGGGVCSDGGVVIDCPPDEGESTNPKDKYSKLKGVGGSFGPLPEGGSSPAGSSKKIGDKNPYIENSDAYTFQKSPALNPSKPKEEYSYNRQQQLLERAIKEGKEEEVVSDKNAEHLTTMDLDKQEEIAKACTQDAAQAYDESENAYTTASKGDYIYDQLVERNKASAKAERSAQVALTCQSVLSNAQRAFLINQTAINNRILRTQGQLQRQNAEQKQYSLTGNAQDKRTQEVVQRTLGSFFPKKSNDAPFKFQNTGKRRELVQYCERGPGGVFCNTR